MDVSLRFKMSQVYRAMLEYAHGMRFLTYQLPRYQSQTPLFAHINIQTNNLCTRRCSFCFYGLEQQTEPCFMADSLFRQAIQNLVELDFAGRVSLYEINEPLTDKRIFAFLRYARRHLSKAMLFLATNGDLLTHEIGNALFENGLDVLHVNSYDTAAYVKNERVVSKLHRHGHQATHIPQLFNRRWSSRAGNIGPYYKAPTAAPCELVYKQIVIKPDGTVCSCCNDFFNRNEIGNITCNSIQAVWFGPQFEVLRQKLALGQRSAAVLCRKCDYKGYGGYIRLKKKKTYPYKPGHGYR
jgi:radical SAM protein with 4Fe4S-binding SPASM domain